ncbi:MAG TPA: hypothetical protein P5110_06175 [Candidatus Omnitrophota bacterium]|nr:hypothetical protein [Candidatus Omnitrophota bacterium]HRZ15079.1 hypothetical protein [Candidatus Omnitrophota bacterium]
MRTRTGLTYVELLVTVVITVIISGIIVVSLSGGFQMLKNKELDSRAMSVAQTQMERTLARGYDYVRNETGEQSWIDGLKTFWNISVSPEETRMLQGKNTPDFRKIPYKNITVTAWYDRVAMEGQSPGQRALRLTAMYPYPEVHLSRQSYHCPYPPSAACKVANYPASDDPMTEYQYPRHPGWQHVVPRSKIEVEYAVEKDIQVYYCVSVYPEALEGIPPTDAIHTLLLFDEVPYGLTEYGGWAPIQSQPINCQKITIPNVKPEQKHTIELRWFRHGEKNTFYLRDLDMTVFATEASR